MSHQLLLELFVYAISVGCLYGALSTRLKVLEKKVDLHNHVVERMYKAEDKLHTIETKMEMYHHDEK